MKKLIVLSRQPKFVSQGQDRRRLENEKG